MLWCRLVESKSQVLVPAGSLAGIPGSIRVLPEPSTCLVEVGDLAVTDVLVQELEMGSGLLVLTDASIMPVSVQTRYGTVLCNLDKVRLCKAVPYCDSS